jgi:4-deoxy-L-threo-5-hexosulose-uronate ketol-isomerase
MNIQHVADSIRYLSMSTQELRDAFLVERLFEPRTVSLTLTDLDRAVIGAAVPVGQPLELPAPEAMRCDFFCQHRELGVLNIGASGSVVVDGDSYTMASLDCRYVGLGAKSVRFASDSAEDPAQFSLLSCPAHHVYPPTLANQAAANPLALGAASLATCRTFCVPR